MPVVMAQQLAGIGPIQVQRRLAARLAHGDGEQRLRPARAGGQKGRGGRLHARLEVNHARCVVADADGEGRPFRAIGERLKAGLDFSAIERWSVDDPALSAFESWLAEGEYQLL